MRTKLVKDLMETNVELISPDSTLQQAAQKMREIDCGFLPVGTNGFTEGVITDRDIIIRAISEGKDPTQEKVRDYMTTDVCACDETDMLEQAAQLMGDNSVGRLVVQRDGTRLCGVLTFGRMLRSEESGFEQNSLIDRAIGRVA